MNPIPGRPWFEGLNVVAQEVERDRETEDNVSRGQSDEAEVVAEIETTLGGFEDSVDLGPP